MMKRFYVLLVLSLCLLLAACGKEEQPTGNSSLVDIPTLPPTEAPDNSQLEEQPTATPTSIPTPTEAPLVTDVPEPTQDASLPPEGMVKSRLTGLWIPEETAIYRPYAIMINNIKVASPQSGLSAADILYEALVEYGITRFMAVFEAQDAMADTTSRIGSVRSARHYYVNLANELDAIYVHFGGTSYASDEIADAHVDEVDGIKGGLANWAFTRDENIQSPHNVFLNFSIMLNEVFNSSLRSEWEHPEDKFFQFYEEDVTPMNGQKAEKVTIQFSQSVRPYLVYDADNREYTRYQFGVLHQDANNDQPLVFKNIIIQYVKHTEISNGYLDLELENAEGDGYYVTNGVAVPIVWKRNETANECHYYDQSGNRLEINVGKTYIAIYPDDYRGGVIFE